AFRPRELDGGNDIGPARYADLAEDRPKRWTDILPRGKVRRALGRVEGKVQTIGVAVRNSDHSVGVHHIMDERNVLVPDALDVVLAIAVLQHCRTFESLDGRDRRPAAFLEIVASRNRPG